MYMYMNYGVESVKISANHNYYGKSTADDVIFNYVIIAADRSHNLGVHIIGVQINEDPLYTRTAHITIRRSVKNGSKLIKHWATKAANPKELLIR